MASGGVYVLAGVSYTYDQSAGSSLTGYLKCGGSLDVLGIITVSVEFDMSLTYYSDGNRIHGVATLTVEISILFFSASVDLTVQRDFAGGSGGQATLLEGGASPQLGPTRSDLQNRWQPLTGKLIARRSRNSWAVGQVGMWLSTADLPSTNCE